MNSEKRDLAGKAICEVPARVLAAQLDLQEAWLRVKDKSGMAGVDGISVGRFGRAADVQLKALASRLAADTYRPRPLRMAELEKKPGGGRRLLLIPAVVDRVAQSAAARWLGARWNPVFDPSSFAYRPGLGVQDALRHVARLRDQGYRWVLDADIQSFFDSIDHEMLFERLAAWLGESSPMLSWIRLWVEADVWDGAEVRRVKRGVPQGSPLSPLLSNYFLNEFDRGLRECGFHFVRYADDFLVLARSPFELAQAKETVEQSLKELHLSLSPEKTRTTTFERCFRFLGAEMQGDSILLPFEKKKTPHPPIFVAPVMPRALFNAYREGHLRAATEFVWACGRTEMKASETDSLQGPGHALHQLAGLTAASVLDSLRRRLP